MTITEAPPPPAPAPRPPVGRGGPLRLAIVVLAVVALGVAAGASWLVIIASLSLMIFLHELGHYLTARWAGMKVTEFFLGFGPRVWSFRRGETEYGIKAIPAGAYVKVIGMYTIEDVNPTEEARTYRQKNWHQRVIMASAGSAMHFLIALALIFALLVGAGAPVGGHLFSDIDESKWLIGSVSERSAAEASGMQQGDRLLSVDGVSVRTFDDLRDVVPQLLDQDVEITYERDGQVVYSHAVITEHTAPSRKGQGMLGVLPEAETERLNPLEAVPVTGREFGAVVAKSVEGMGKLFSPSGLGNFFDQVSDGSNEAHSGQSGGTAPSTDDQNRLISIYGAARIGVGLLESGVAAYLFLLVALNVFIGLFNLVPLLPLDGGHIAVATYERVRELFRRDGRRYFVDVAKLMPLTYAVVLVMVLIGVSSLYLDIVNPVNVP
jgi:membrane-associated protease RseP (regulator of RpoE activity)